MSARQPGDNLDLLPPNATPLQRALSKTSARILDTDTDVIRRERDPNACDAAFVPVLAAERSVHHWAPGDDAGNRARTASSFEDHLDYGSPDALESEIAQDTGQTVRIVEYFEDPALHFPQFYVDFVINSGDPTPDTQALMQSALRRKNVRDMPATRVRVIQPEGELYVGAACHFTNTIRLAPQPPDPQLYAGAASRYFNTIRILPRAS